MKRFFQVILTTALCASATGISPVSAKPVTDRNQLGSVVKSMNEGRMSRMDIPFKDKKAATLTAMMNKSGLKKAPESESVFTGIEYFDYLEAPDGSVWYATGEFDFETISHEAYTQKTLKGFKYTIYDSYFQKIGEIKDVIEYKDDEVRAVQYEIASVVTQKFFNYDNNYEVIFSLGMNTTSYENRYYSYAYSIGGEKDADGNDVPIMEFQGTLCDAVDSSTDSWSENFYLSFSYEEKDESKVDSENYLDYLSTFKMVIDTYKKASYSGGPTRIAQKKIRLMDLPGDQMSTSPMLSFASEGKAYFVYQQYEKSFFVDPTGWTDESLSEDNHLIVEINSIGAYDQALKEEKRISIPTDQTFGDDKVLCTYYGAGHLGYNEDIVKDGDDYKVVIAKQKYISGNDDATTDSYYIYNSDGEVEKTLAEDIVGFMGLSDVPGYDHQYMFITVTNMGYMLSFVDVPSGDVAAMFTNIVDGYSLSSYVDRVPAALGYKYAFKAMNPISEDGCSIERVVWLDADGKVIGVDKINLGKDVANAMMLMSQNVLSPYYCNTDDEHEYMFFIKKYRPNGAAGTDTHMVITAANSYDVLLDLTADAEKGELRQVAPVTMPQNNTLLAIYEKNNAYNVDAYSLPFTRFVGGDGTVDNPYLIATPGDFREIGKSLSSHYRIVNDIDFSEYTMSTFKGAFVGSVDGGGYTLSNIDLTGLTGIFDYLSEGASVKNLNLYKVKVDCSGSSLAGTLASSALGTKIDNVHVYALDAKASDDTSTDFGGIVGRATNFSVISNSSVNGVIDMPGSSVGGIVGETRTSSSVKASSFIGTIIGATEVGGIVGSASNSGDSFTDCHVDAALTARNTVGGIAGASSRAAITRCYVEGSIKAVGGEARWYDNGPCAGGVVGSLGADTGNSSLPEGDGSSEKVNPITNCFVNLSSLEGYTPELPEEYPGQQATIHRIAGRSNANYEPDIVGEDEDWNPIYGDPRGEESAISNNYAVASLALGAEDATAEHNTVEGKSVDASELSAEWFKNTLGLVYGTSVDAPWRDVADNDPALYHEAASIIDPVEISVMEGNEFDINVFLVRAVPFTEEEFIDNFTYECSDESVVDMTGSMNYADGVAAIGFKALKPGKATITMFGSKCEVTVIHDETLGIGNIADASEGVVVIAGTNSITVKNAAEGAAVEVYTLAGVKVFATVATGAADINVDVTSGLYIVKAGNKAVKCLVK